MDRLLRPDRFDVEPSDPGATKKWLHWLRTFQNFISSLTDAQQLNKLNLLINYISPNVFEFVSDSTNFEDAIQTLSGLYDKPKNEIFARHLLATCKQESGQTLDQFMQKLKSLAKDCNFKAATALEIRDEAIRDSFISGLLDGGVRQRLLEKETLNLSQAFETARSLELAHQQSLTYQSHPVASVTASGSDSKVTEDLPAEAERSSIAAASSKCYFCGYSWHPRPKCPAREAECNKCGKKGHFSKACKSSAARPKHTAALDPQLLGALTAAVGPLGLESALIPVLVNGKQLTGLIDTGSSESYINTDIPSRQGWKVHPSKALINMASTSLTKETAGHVKVRLKYKKRYYNDFKLSLLPNLCCDIILGHDFIKLHTNLIMNFQSKKETISVCGVAAAKVEAPSLFENLSEDCRPIATKSRRHNPDDSKFIDSEIRKLLEAGIIEPSTSPWRAQVLVTKNERQKKRMVVDYSQTINRFTYLDAYPLPRLDQMVETLATEFEVFSTLDLKSAYHQVPIKKEDKPYTAFEAAGGLYQFTRIPFGVTNGVACFQRLMQSIIDREGLTGTFAYVDNVTLGGKNQVEHDKTLQEFLRTAAKYNITFNETKNVLGVPLIDLAGYRICKGQIRPDPERLRPLQEMPPPTTLKGQKRVVGMFAYYSSWIENFSEKIRALNLNATFPLPEPVLLSFNALKAELEKAVLVSIDHSKPLTVETDASDHTISASLNQEGRPVAFYSRTLSGSEKSHSAVEKEAYAIVESIKKWRHFLLNTHFKLVTDQESVAFIYSKRHKGKIKNEKIQRWKIELSCFSFDVVYRPGSENSVADALSRATCGATSDQALRNLHDALSHPGVTRMVHFVRSRNLPYSVEEIKSMTSNCNVCREIKPSFFKPNQQTLIKATQPFERLSIDFKGPLPSASRNKYILTMTDEFTRFPFAFPCPDMTSATVISRFCQVFSMFGMPAYVHSDRGPSFMSEELKTFLHSKGIATSRTTPYNPRGNGQVEKLNGTIWKAIQLTLKSRELDISHWEVVLLDVLHSIRSLLCTETNCTPHERMFQHARRSTAGNSLPTWLLTPGPVFLKRSVRQSKFDPLVDEVDLISANPQYATVKLRDGREATVSLRQLAPRGEVGERAASGSDALATPRLARPEEMVPRGPAGPLERSGPDPTTAQPDALASQAEEPEGMELRGHTCPLGEIEADAGGPTGPSNELQPCEGASARVPFVRTSFYNLRSGKK